MILATVIVAVAKRSTLRTEAQQANRTNRGPDRDRRNGVNDWDAEHPPADGKRVIARWQVIDVFRSSAAILGFGLLLVGLVLQASEPGAAPQPRKTGFPVFSAM